VAGQRRRRRPDVGHVLPAAFGGAAAAAVVDNRLKTTAVVRTADEITTMSPRERLEYSRRFDQRKMPDWKDQRGVWGSLPRERDLGMGSLMRISF
jgi:hypothetical protein